MGLKAGGEHFLTLGDLWNVTKEAMFNVRKAIVY